MNVDDLERTPYKRSDNRKIVLVKDFEDDKEYKKVQKRKFLKKVVSIGAVIIIIIVMILSVRSVLRNHTYGSIKTVHETQISDFSDADYTSYADGVIRYGDNGAEYIHVDGNVIWNVSYNMKNPEVFIEGEYAVIADIGGSDFIICDEKGVLSDASAPKTIIDADISASGAVCLVTDDDAADYVNFYDKSGKLIDIEIRTVLAGDGYPMDMSLSPNGQVLMMSYLYMNEGMMLNKVVFYNFSELGQNYSDRLVGVFNDYDDSIVPVVQMISDDYACAFAQDRVDFYSLKNPTKPELITSYMYDAEIKSVFSSDEYVGVISSGNNGIAGNNLDIYTLDGIEAANAAVSFDYDEVKFFKDRVVLNNNNYCIIYTVDGSLKYQGELDGMIDYVMQIKNNRLLRFADNKMFEIKLKY